MYADVIVPLPIANTYTYALPEGMEREVMVGSRVVVPFGRKKFYTAIIVRLHDTPPAEYETKDVVEVLDTHPIILPNQYRFWEWIASYYLCTMGDVYKAALPAGMKLESETVVELNSDYEATEPLPEREQRILDLLTNEKEQSITILEKESGLKNILTVVKSLIDKEAIFVKEELKRTYKPRTEACVRIVPDNPAEERLHELFQTLGRAPKQLALLMRYVELSGLMGGGKRQEVTKKELITKANVSEAVLKGLVDKGVFEVYHRETGRLRDGLRPVNELRPLSDAQRQAMQRIQQVFGEKNVCLLHGVTSSGKTEVYIHLIQETLKAGRQVLYLLPEIALTTQITNRLKEVFGDHLGVYHSKFPDAERVEIWQKQLSEQPYDIILGVRSSVFLPFRNLGLVIVDEEHENSYKQQDPAPRYHARSAAIVLASIYGAKTLLGTATPSVESYYNARHGKYGLVELTERYQDIKLPRIEVVDIADLKRRKVMKSHFSPLLLEEMRKALEQKEQVILFQNRRGFSQMIECNVCGWVPRCRNCDVSLTYHKGVNQLTCHYCGTVYQVPHSCPACGNVELIKVGVGTERIEDDIKEIFPEARIARMDLDTTRSRSSYERIINDFQEGKTDILIGTQMVSKGLDFDHVSVVGILNADTLLSFPDFRAYEHAFQLMAQVAGRAGRKNKQGKVILQTKKADLPVIQQVVTNDYLQLYNDTLVERKLTHFPPFTRLIYIFVKHKKEETAETAAREMAARLTRVLGTGRVKGPAKPPVSRIQLFYIRQIMIKTELEISFSKLREFLLNTRQSILEDERFRSLIVYYDVDPQ